MIREQASSVSSRQEAVRLLDNQRRLVDVEERRKDRADVTVSITSFLGFFDMLAEQVAAHVTSPEERAAVGQAFDVAVRRAGLSDLVAGFDGSDRLH